MNFISQTRDEFDEKKLPDNVYFPVVRALYADTKTLFVGIFSMFLAPLLLYWKTTDPVHLLFSGLFLLFGILRIYLSTAFETADEQPISRVQYEAWENRYVYVGSIYVGLLGLWFIAGVSRSDDPFVYLMTTLMTISYLIGIIGRNFSSDKMVSAQAALAGTTLISGSVILGDVYHGILAIFLLPFFIAIKLMSTRLRIMLFRSEITAETNRTIARRFDVALKNIAHGVAMLNDEGIIVVANERFVRLSGIGDVNPVGSDLSSLLSVSIASDGVDGLIKQIQFCFDGGVAKRFSVTLESGKTIEVDYNAMSGGGVVVLSDISDRVASENAIRKLASYDPLTNLPNRRFFVSEVERLLSNDGALDPCSMFFVDLDKFKEVNDTLGHAVGDKLLRTIADRLQSMLPTEALICRFGGDEFVIVVPGENSEEFCSALAEKVILETSLPLVIDGNQINVGASIGIATAPKDGNKAVQLLQYTDAALYEAKAKGRSTYTFYSEELGEMIRFRRELEMDIRAALDSEQFEVYYQPLVNLEKGRVTTCEALLRWKHPIHGNISPGTFVQVAEESGLITQLGEYVLRKAAQDCLTWPEHVRVAVNVSSIQFHKTDVVNVVSDVLAETGLPPSRMEIEVTETVMLYNIQETTVTLNLLVQMGVNISLDDFGTGFSSLSYLHSMPFDKVKIDRSFVDNGLADMRSLTLLKGVVDLIKNLGLSVVLEGIETEEQIQLLVRNMKVDEVQGYLFARPMPGKDIRTLLHGGAYEEPEQPLAENLAG